MHLQAIVHALRLAGHEVVISGPPGTQSAEFGGESSLLSWLRARIPRVVYESLELAYSVLDGSRLLLAALRLKPDVIYERYNLFAPAGIWVKRLLGIPLILEINAPLFDERSRYGGIALARLARWSERYVWTSADACLPVTRVLAGIVAAAGVPEDRIHVIPNGIDPDELVPSRPPAAVRRELFGDAERLVLGFVGFVRDWHGLDRIIDLLRDPRMDMYEPALLVVGDGPARAGLERRAASQGLEDRVVFTGVVGRDEVKNYVAVFDIALQPSVVGYASPLKLFEYLALGRAIVAPAMPNIEEVLRDGDNALLFPPDKPAVLADRIVQLAAEPALRQRLQHAARATIGKGGYTWCANAARIESLAIELTQAR